MREEIVYLKVDDLKNNPNNPRKNEEAVESVAKSIERYGFRNPLIVDKNNVVWCGNTRLKASKKLGLKEVPCIVVKDLTEKQMMELALLDNKTNEIAEWDFDMLLDIIPTIDLDDFDLDWGIRVDNIDDEYPYTNKINVPQYEITGICPDIYDLIDRRKTIEIEEEIKKANITDEQKDFLINAAKRHLVFDYSKIAEYYAHQSKEMQELMEKSALVIIDFNDAIKNGYVELRESLMELMENDEE